MTVKTQIKITCADAQYDVFLKQFLASTSNKQYAVKLSSSMNYLFIFLCAKINRNAEYLNCKFEFKNVILSDITDTEET